MYYENFTDKNFNEKDLITHCPSCGSTNFSIKNTGSVHHLQQVCRRCGKQVKFLPNPEKPSSQRTESTKYKLEHVLAVTKQEEKRCFFCRRKKKHLGKNETLELDHITPLSEGGEDRPENLQVLCTACHKLRHHFELYHFKHLRCFFNE